MHLLSYNPTLLFLSVYKMHYLAQCKVQGARIVYLVKRQIESLYESISKQAQKLTYL